MSKEAIEHYEAALKEAFPSGATGDVFHHWNEARKALAEQPAQQLPVGVGGGLVAIKTLLSRDPCAHAKVAIEMIDAMLSEQPAQQEPFGYFRYDLRLDAWVQNREGRPGTPFYTSPQAQRTWVGLKDAEIDQGLLRSDYAFKTAEAWRAGVVFAMTKLKEKNQ